MSASRDPIPLEVLHRFIRAQMSGKLLCVAVSGAHAQGFPSNEAPLELKALHVEPTENLLGITQPPHVHNYVGEFETHRIDYSSMEIGPALQRLLRGDGSILERILAPRQLLTSEDLRRLQRAAKGIVCRRFFTYYRSFVRGASKDQDEGAPHTVRQVLNAYRHALTGVHLLKTGELELDLPTLARTYNLSQVEELIKSQEERDEAVPEDSARWLNKMVKLHTLLEDSYEQSTIPIDPEHPREVEEFLLDMRRRFFDAMTRVDS
jgi:uncharacterized protein